MAIPIFSKIFIDNYLIGGHYNWVNYIIIFLLIFIILQIALMYLQRQIMNRLENILSFTLSTKLIKKLLSLPITFFDQRRPGDLISQIDANERVMSFISGPFLLNIVSLIQSIIYLLVMIMYSWILTLIVVVFTSIDLIVYIYIRERRKSLAMQSRIASSSFLSITMQGLNMINTLQSTGKTGTFYKKWYDQMVDNINVSVPLQLISSLIENIGHGIKIILHLSVFAVGIFLILNQQLTLGELIAFQALYLLFVSPIKRIVDMGNQLQLIEADNNRVDDVTNQK